MLLTIGLSVPGLPWFSWSRICLQCRGPGFKPWIGKIPWRREWLATPVFLPGEFHEQRNLVGYKPRGRKELDTTERLNNFTYLHCPWLGYPEASPLISGCGLNPVLVTSAPSEAPPPPRGSGQTPPPQRPPPHTPLCPCLTKLGESLSFPGHPALSLEQRVSFLKSDFSKQYRWRLFFQVCPRHPKVIVPFRSPTFEVIQNVVG